MDHVWVMLRCDFDVVDVRVSTTRDGALRRYQESVPPEQWRAFYEHYTKTDTAVRDALGMLADHLAMSPEVFLAAYMGEPSPDGDDTVWGQGDNFVLVGQRTLA